MYKKPTFDGYNNGKQVSFVNKNNINNEENKTMKIYNALLGILDFNDYYIRVFTMSFNDIGVYQPYFLLLKDYKSERQGKMVCVSVIKPEYIKLKEKYHEFKLNKEECKALYEFLCSYDYSKTLPSYLKLENCDTSYTQYSNYINFLNIINKGNEDWREIPLDTGCPKYNDHMNVYEDKKEINNHEYNG